MPSSRGSHLASGEEGNKKRKAEFSEERKVAKRQYDSQQAEIAEIRESVDTSAKSQDLQLEKKRNRHVFGKILLIVLALCFALGVVGLGTAVLITHGPSEKAKTMFVRTFIDTGTVRWVPRLFMSQDDVVYYANPKFTVGTTKYKVEKEAAVTEVVIEPVPEDVDVIELVDISGPSWHGKMLVVRDPSLVTLAIPKAMEERGVYGLDQLMDVEEFCEMYGAIGGITAGGFNMETGLPAWFVIKDGKVIIDCGDARTGAVGFTADHKMIVGTMSQQEALDMGIVEGLGWWPILIENGIKNTGIGGGYNPRAAIGQKADGTVILVLMEGRMVSSLGASYDDLADFMEEQGCINAMNLDSGRSSVMVYEGAPVTKIAVGAGIQTTNRAAPNAFVVMPEGWTDD